MTDSNPRPHEVSRVEPRSAEELLVPEDYDRALRQMKHQLTLLQLRRALLDPRLDAASVLALSDRIVALQAAAA